jgi:hypothetical protein
MLKLTRIAILLFIVTSCLNTKKDVTTVAKYIGNSGYKPSLPDLRDSTLVLAFTSYFDKDSIEIMTQDFSKKINLSTSPITGLSEIIVLGKIKNQKEITVKLNSYRPIRINATLENQIFVISYHNDSLKIESVYHLPSFR